MTWAPTATFANRLNLVSFWKRPDSWDCTGSCSIRLRPRSKTSSMPKSLRVLYVEDQERDVALLTRHLSRAGYDLLSERVDTAAAMKAALETKEWDVILCDYSMPQFSAAAALTLLTEVVLDIPFIIISGTVGEAVAVEAMRAGAHD